MEEFLMTLDELVQVVPSKRQLEYQQTEFYAFTHFTVNTFTDKEWGDGTEPESCFNPADLDARQWASCCRDAGMKGLILTCKHHDGFCLWPSAYTEHSVKNSPYKNGNGDVVREVSDACHEYGLKFGVYLSPWDRNSKVYGSGKDYDDYYCAQLTELLTNYGDIFCVWMDGACGEGPNGKKQVYDFNRYFALVRELQPDTCLAICGCDIRWCGNESGLCRDAEWSVVPASLNSANDTIKKSQHSVEDAERLAVGYCDKDIGSRELMLKSESAIWYPCEVDTSIRPGWFYHESQNNEVRTLEDLRKVYYGSVGGNGMLLLNIPPDKRGLFHENDAARLKELGESIRKDLGHNYLDETAMLSATNNESGHDIKNILSDSYDTYYATEDGVDTCDIEIAFSAPKEISFVTLKENITLSQRVEQFSIDAYIDGIPQTIYNGQVIGYKKIACFDKVRTDRIRIRVLKSRLKVTFSYIAVH